MDIQRFVKHLMTPPAKVKRHFPQSVLHAIEHAIAASEAQHSGEIRFVVEGALDGAPLFKGQSPRDRALDLFSELRVWDTEFNNGLLIYVLLADRAVEIVADRGINAQVAASTWTHICQQMEQAFQQSSFESGVVSGVQAITQQLAQHFPANSQLGNELPNQAVVL
ncbi:TPM domain-containing protein [Rhodoferax aquaticus]|uniref:TPM domain-containing protein n=1 Tax=Rhodoferax aquaticus TaxID=2527691 RepID=A0A515EKL3_9BURK|nr:TPM domain-containing protein [Rhodoferax aquaticus]QDL53190.1 hypothetical protein EXZ61_02820 [Rhodoferax aquaticus]